MCYNLNAILSALRVHVSCKCVTRGNESEMEYRTWRSSFRCIIDLCIFHTGYT